MNRKLLLTALSLLSLLAASRSFADSSNTSGGASGLSAASAGARNRAYRRGVIMRICVDQALSSQGLTLKLPIASDDVNTKSAIVAAITQCKTELASRSGQSTTGTASSQGATSTSGSTTSPATPATSSTPANSN